MLKAVQHIRRVRGGSQAQVMQADDGNFYVVKFQGNPQDTRVLANEYLACRLARMLGLNVPEPVIIEVDEATISDQHIVFALAGHDVADYNRTLRAQLTRSMALATGLSRVAVTGTGRTTALAALSLAPSAIRWVATSTRIPQSSLDLTGNVPGGTAIGHNV